MNYLTKTRILVITVIILSILLVSLLLTIGYRYYTLNRISTNFRNARMEQESGDFIGRTLQLAPEQREQFCVLRDNFRQNFDSIDNQVRAVSRLIMEQISQTNPNNDTLNMLVNRYAELQKEQKTRMVEHLLEVKSMCNPEQQKQFCRIMGRMKNFQRGHYNDRMRRGQSQNPRNNNNNQN